MASSSADSTALLICKNTSLSSSHFFRSRVLDLTVVNIKQPHHLWIGEVCRKKKKKKIGVGRSSEDVSLLALLLLFYYC